MLSCYSISGCLDSLCSMVVSKWRQFNRLEEAKIWIYTCNCNGGCFPALKLSVSIFNLKPVSHYVSLRFSSENSEQYGQQQKVISDIKFLKKEIGRKPCPIFSFIVGEKFNFWWSFLDDKIENTSCVPKFGSAPQDKLRIIAFLYDLEQYEESVLVRMLNVLNMVLKVCEINFVLALDKNIIRKAFQTSSQNEDEVDHFISRIIQLPVTLVHPAVDEWGKEDNSKGVHDTENNDGQDNTDIEKGRKDPEACSSKILLKRVTQVQGMWNMTNSNEEIETFCKLSCFASDISELHQSYTSYHKFARNVISQTKGSAIEIPNQWKVELVAWIFICSQWRHEMNILIKDWHAYIDIKDENEEKNQEPSLKEIVSNYINKQDDSKGEEKKQERTRLKETLATIQDTPKKVSFGFEEMQLQDVLPRWVLKMGIEVSMIMDEEKKRMDDEKKEKDR